eukprot:m.80745 g.80745  ORF g.80745 m.80745 type:complete len:60 (-) comp8633_c0_seq1:47-226(-)
MAVITGLARNESCKSWWNSFAAPNTMLNEALNKLVISSTLTPIAAKEKRSIVQKVVSEQ